MIAFCWLPPDILRAIVAGPWPLRTSYCFYQALGVLQYGVLFNKAVVLELRLPVTLQNHVVGQRVIQHQTVLVAVLRDVAHTGFAALADGAFVMSLPSEGDGAGRGFFEARNTVDQLALAVAVDTGNADDLARADVEADAADGIVLVDLARH